VVIACGLTELPRYYIFAKHYYIFGKHEISKLTTAIMFSKKMKGVFWDSDSKIMLLVKPYPGRRLS